MLPPQISLRTDGTSSLFSLDSRDSSTFGLPVYNLSRQNPSETPGGVSPLDQRSIRDYLGSDYLLTARINSDLRSQIDTFQGIGFRNFETTLHPRLSLKGHLGITKHERVHITTINQREVSEAEEIARTAFSVSRFHRDPTVADASANERFAGWVRSSFLDNEKTIYVFRIDGFADIAGFFVVRRVEQSSFWELTAIASAFRGQGLSRLIWESFVALEASLGTHSIETNISSENLAVVGLYPRLGFSFANSSQVLHFHSSWMK